MTRTPARARAFRLLAGAILAGVLAAPSAMLPASPALAAVACRVTSDTVSWPEGPDVGGFHATLEVENLGGPIDGWTLEFTLPAGQSFRQGWGADWHASGRDLTAASLPWNALLDTGASVRIGFLGGWSGTSAAASAFRLNGTLCTGEPAENQPPTITLTSPEPDDIAVLPGTMRLAAEASDPDGAIQEVQFFIDDTQVGTDTEAPYEVTVPTPWLSSFQGTAWARAVDDGSPPLTADSERARFFVVTVPPLGIVAEPTSLTVPEGGSATFNLRMSASGADAAVDLTVSAASVTVSPTSVLFGLEHTEQEITVTAAPGSAGSVVTVTAAADPSQLISPAEVTVTVTSAPSQRVANPYEGAQVYVDVDWAQRVSDQAAATSGDLGTRMAAAATRPTAVWLDGIDSLTEGRGLAGHLDAALAQRESATRPMVVQLVLYNHPGRDCLGRAAPGELTTSAADQERYRTDFIDPIVEILSRPEYADLRVVTVIEPGAVSTPILSRPGSPMECVGMGSVESAYLDAVRYALGRLAELPNTYNYLDFSFSGLFGYPDNFVPAGRLYADLVLGPEGPGAEAVAGFVTNLRQYAPLWEPFLYDATLRVGGVPLYQSSFLDWNREIHELEFAQHARDLLIELGFSSTIGMVIDTSRNGWGGPDRPTRASTSTDLNTFVDESRVDRRPTRTSWCNQVGAGIGERPMPTPAPGIHAFAWLTPPGVSDGVADPAAPSHPDRPWLRHRPQCDPLWVSPGGRLIPSNAMPGAPHAGEWFPEFFAQLVRNAYPPLD